MSSLLHWQPLRELTSLRHQMNRLFDELMHGERDFNWISEKLGGEWLPAIELKETDTELILKAAIPGRSAKDLEVQVSPDRVHIAGVHHAEQKTEQEGMVHSEFHYGQFHRTIPLPMVIQPDRVEATFKDGLLTLILPKATTEPPTIVKLNLEEKTRETVTHQRQHATHLQDTMRSRAEAMLETPDPLSVNPDLRETVTQQRQHEAHLQDTLHQRASSDLGTPTNV